MQFFTEQEFNSKYAELANVQIPTWQIEASCEMIFSQVGLKYRDTSWDETSVPLPIKNASMEQLRFMLEHDIPFLDLDKNISVDGMSASLITDYSTLALRILANNGYLYRGAPLMSNMTINADFKN